MLGRQKAAKTFEVTDRCGNNTSSCNIADEQSDVKFMTARPNLALRASSGKNQSRRPIN